MEEFVLKKILIALSVVCSLMFVGCRMENQSADYMSEQTWTYFYGANGGVKCSISVGERERDYKLDGKHGNVCDFSLIILFTSERFIISPHNILYFQRLSAVIFI